MLDLADHSAFEFTLNSSFVSYRIGCYEPWNQSPSVCFSKMFLILFKLVSFCSLNNGIKLSTATRGYARSRKAHIAKPGNEWIRWRHWPGSCTDGRQSWASMLLSVLDNDMDRRAVTGPPAATPTETDRCELTTTDRSTCFSRRTPSWRAVQTSANYSRTAPLATAASAAVWRRDARRYKTDTRRRASQCRRRRRRRRRVR